jgi:hypothetical protein
MDYDEQCKAATTDQGLDPVIEALTAAGIPHALEQTGGFTMAVTVEAPSGTFAVTKDDGYMLGHYPDGLWETAEGDAAYSYDLALAEIVERVRSEAR